MASEPTTGWSPTEPSVFSAGDECRQSLFKAQDDLISQSWRERVSAAPSKLGHLLDLPVANYHLQPLEIPLALADLNATLTWYPTTRTPATAGNPWAREKLTDTAGVEGSAEQVDYG